MDENLTQFGRVERLVGRQGLERLRKSFAVVVGLGAVGSYAVEGLARAGVGKIRLVDFDKIRESNLNRQLYALHSTLGRPKFELARERVLDINPACEVEALELFAHRETFEAVLAGDPGLVIDAIDSFTPKVEFLAELVRRGLPLISSMGAATRTDPTQIRVGPLKGARNCPLAARVRHRLRVKKVALDFYCVYSLEEPRTTLDNSSQKEVESPVGELIRGRVRAPLGSLPTLTGIFGLMAANEGLKILLGGSFLPPRPQSP